MEGGKKGDNSFDFGPSDEDEPKQKAQPKLNFKSQAPVLRAPEKPANVWASNGHSNPSGPSRPSTSSTAGFNSNVM